MTPQLSVVLPLYATRSAVQELVERLVGALEGFGPVELVFVDDCCPQRSSDAVPAALVGAAAGAAVVVIRHERNYGQQAAVVTGLRAATGDVVAIMDTDLQDAPEDLARLVARLKERSGACDAVAAGRRGRYEGPVRRATALVFRHAVHRLSRRRIPADAAMFLVMTRAARHRVLALDDPRVHVVAALARVGARVESAPVLRRRRPAGSSAYPSWARLRVAVRAILVLTPAYPLARRLERRWRAPIVAVQVARTTLVDALAPRAGVDAPGATA